MQREISKYLPLVITLEEFETLTALTDCLLPERARHRSTSFAALFDHALHQAKRGHWKSTELPPDSRAIRHGLQLLNDDALRFYGGPFSALSVNDQEAVLAKLQTDGDLHWPQFPAGRWYNQVLSIITDLYMSWPDSYLSPGNRNRWDRAWIAKPDLDRPNS